jgi:hypothetical protein
VDRYSFIVVDLHHLLLAGLPAHFESSHASQAVWSLWVCSRDRIFGETVSGRVGFEPQGGVRARNQLATRSRMAWRAETVHGQIAVGTELSIYKEPWEPGKGARSLPSGVSLATRFAHGAEAQIKVLEVTGSDAIIRTLGVLQLRRVQLQPPPWALR